MFSRAKALSEISGKEVFRRLLGANVYDEKRECIGFLKRVYFEKKTGKAKRVVIKLVDGSLAALDPASIVLDSGGMVIKKLKIDMDKLLLDTKLVKVDTLIKELKKIRERIFELNEAHIAGQLTRSAYESFRGILEQRRQKMLAEIKGCIEDLETYMAKLESSRDKLLKRVNSRECSTEERVLVLEKLRDMRRELARVCELISNAKCELALEMNLEEFIKNYLRSS